MSTTGKQYSLSSESSDAFQIPHRTQTGLGVEEKTLTLFQPDILLPSQYLATTRRKIPSQPEKKLMLAILEDAVVCFQKFLFAQHGRRKTLFREAEEWLFQESSQWVFSFENVCDALSLNASYLRKGLSEWKRKEELIKDPKAEVYPLRMNREPKKRPAHVSGAKKQKHLKAAVNS